MADTEKTMPDSYHDYIEDKWTELLLKWLNRCVHPKSPVLKLKKKCLEEVLKTYKKDICEAPPESNLSINDIELMLKYNYPLLKFSQISKTNPNKKLYIMTSVLLYHCCISSIEGRVDSDICVHLDRSEQEMILKFCERLTDMSINCDNVELSIKYACQDTKPKTKPKLKQPSTSGEVAAVTYDPHAKVSTISEQSSSASMSKKKNIRFDSSVTVLPSSMNVKSSADYVVSFTFLKDRKEKKNTEVEDCIECAEPEEVEDKKSKKDKKKSKKDLEVDACDGCSEDSDVSDTKGKKGKKKKKKNINDDEEEAFDDCIETFPETKGKKGKKNKKNVEDDFVECTGLCVETENKKGKKGKKVAASDVLEAYIESCEPVIEKKTKKNKKDIETEDFGDCCVACEDTKGKKDKKKKKKSSSDYSSTDDDCIEFCDMEMSTDRKSKKNKKKKSKDAYVDDCFEPPSEPVKMKKGKKNKRNFSSSEFEDDCACDYDGNKNNKSICIEARDSHIDACNSKRDKKWGKTKKISSSEDCQDYVVSYNLDKKSKNSTDVQADLDGVEYKQDYIIQSSANMARGRCQPECYCDVCRYKFNTCASTGGSMYQCWASMDAKNRGEKKGISLWKILVPVVVILIATVATVLIFQPWKLFYNTTVRMDEQKLYKRMAEDDERMYIKDSFVCRNGLCQKAFLTANEKIYPTLSRCILQCMGPQLWPQPVGFTYYSDKIVAMATSKMEYKFLSIPSDAVHAYLAHAFKLFIADLARLERIDLDTKDDNDTDLYVRRMNILIDVETDPDPRLRLDTDESYNLKIEIIKNVVTIKITAPSFCGARHGLETLSQVILLDQNTGYLITLSNIVIKDAPSYKYRGVMIDTGRNYIPVQDLIRTVDAMATCKLNTLHWRISDVTSFPLLLPSLPQLFEFGGYDRALVYTKEDVKSVVRRAEIRGVRVLLEVAAPGPVGRAWSWTSEATCPTKTANLTCDTVLCLRLSTSDAVMDILQVIYSEIIEMTKVTDVFHLSDGLFSMIGCYYLIEEREGFLEKALERLKVANKGFLPKLPIIWFTEHLAKSTEAAAWHRLGVQMTAWQPNPSDPYLSKYKVIQSSRWDLSCEIRRQRCLRYRTWQSMYAWGLWRDVDAFSIEGGESMLWTDLVDSGNLDLHLWPRAAAVAERLWSDVAVNSTVVPSVYIRLDSHRWRMLIKSVKVPPVWPVFCSYSPEKCLRQIKPMA